MNSRHKLYISYRILVCIFIFFVGLIPVRTNASKKKVFYYTVNDISDIPVKFNGGNYYYHSTNLDVLQFSETGKMIARKIGNATVILTYFGKNNKPVRTKFKVRIHARVKKLKWKKTQSTLYVGEKYLFSVKYKAKSKKNIIKKWSSSNPEVATVDNNGMVSAVNRGTTIIKCQIKGQKKAVLLKKVEVKYIPISSLEYEDSYIRLCPDTYYNLNEKIKIYPEDATNKILDTYSDNNSIVSVSNGILYGVNKGEAVVTVSATDWGREKIQIKVLVDDWLNRDDIKLIAHRGLSGEAPENTLRAFELAGEQGFYATECDVFLTKDEKFVVNHDGDLKRICGVDKKISELTLEEIKSYTITSGSNYEKYKDDENAINIPTLDEYLNVCINSNIIPMIEVKFTEGNLVMDDSNPLFRLYKDVKNIMGNRPVFIISIYENTIENINEIMKEYSENNVRLCLLVWYNRTTDSIKIYDYCRENNIGFSIGYQGNDDLLREMKKDGCLVGVWTIDDCEQARHFINLGADFIVTDKILWNSR